MERTRVKLLFDGGFKIGKKLKKSLLITECVPGGTSTAFAVLSGLGINVNGLISGSHRNPPSELKTKLVNQGLKAAKLKKNPSSIDLMAAVGDPFQPIAVGLLMGARESGQEILLGGGCQMLAVLALALNEIEPESRSEFVGKILIGTTSWLVDESLSSAKNRNSFIHLMNHVANHFKVNILGLASGYRFNDSNQKVLRDYEIGYVKEGVGAGALSLLAQIKGLTQKEMIERCDIEVDNLFKSKMKKLFKDLNNMNTNTFGRREFIKYGLISSLFLLSGCSTSQKKLALRGVSNSFPSEFINSLSTAWEFFPIKDIEFKKFSYNSTLQEKTDLLVLNDGWISDLPINSLQEIKADNIRNNFSKQTNSFLDGLGEDYKKKLLPLAVSPWVILFRNEDSLALKNKNSWEVIFSKFT